LVGFGSTTSGLEAFRWTSGGGMVGLGDLPGGSTSSVAYAVSADGSVVVGSSESASGTEAFLWTSGGGMVGLGDLPGGGFSSIAWDASADGSVVVGRSDTASVYGSEAFLWTSAGGMQNLYDVLLAGGATGLTGWTLGQAFGVSGDGRTIVGLGFNPSGEVEAWVATVPEPSTLVLAACGAIGLVVLDRRSRRRHVLAALGCVAVLLGSTPISAYEGER
jgi:probable HAF family extracellular repeat protein